MADEEVKDPQPEIAASGWEAPTKEQAKSYIQTMSDMLESHGCPTTRDLIAAATLCFDIAHRDSHTPMPETVKAATEKLHPMMQPLTDAIANLAATLPTSLERAHFFARINSVFFLLARRLSVLSVQEAIQNQQEQEIAEAEKPVDLPPEITMTVEPPITEDKFPVPLTEEQKRLLSLATSKWKN